MTESLAISTWRRCASDVRCDVGGNDSVGRSDERELVDQARRDPEAITQLYRRHAPAIAGYIRRRVGCTHDAEDLISETFFAMVRNLPRYRMRGAPFRAWLYRLATTQVSRWARSKRKAAIRTLSEDPGPRTSDADDQVAVRREGVRTALIALPTKFQDVLSLHYLEGLSVVETASVLGCSEGTVKSRLSRGRARMRAQLELLEIRHEC